MWPHVGSASRLLNRHGYSPVSPHTPVPSHPAAPVRRHQCSRGQVPGAADSVSDSDSADDCDMAPPFKNAL